MAVRRARSPGVNARTSPGPATIEASAGQARGLGRDPISLCDAGAMSVNERSTKKGIVYDARYRDERGKPKSKTFTKRKDAEAFDGGVRAAKYNGTAMPDKKPRVERGMTVEEFAVVYWRDYAQTEL